MVGPSRRCSGGGSWEDGSSDEWRASRTLSHSLIFPLLHHAANAITRITQTTTRTMKPPCQSLALPLLVRVGEGEDSTAALFKVDRCGCRTAEDCAATEDGFAIVSMNDETPFCFIVFADCGMKSLREGIAIWTRRVLYASGLFASQAGPRCLVCTLAV